MINAGVPMIYPPRFDNSLEWHTEFRKALYLQFYDKRYNYQLGKIVGQDFMYIWVVLAHKTSMPFPSTPSSQHDSVFTNLKIPQTSLCKSVNGSFMIPARLIKSLAIRDWTTSSISPLSTVRAESPSLPVRWLASRANNPKPEST